MNSSCPNWKRHYYYFLPSLSPLFFLSVLLFYFLFFLPFFLTQPFSQIKKSLEEKKRKIKPDKLLPSSISITAYLSSAVLTSNPLNPLLDRYHFFNFDWVTRPSLKGSTGNFLVTVLFLRGKKTGRVQRASGLFLFFLLLGKYFLLLCSTFYCCKCKSWFLFEYFGASLSDPYLSLILLWH